MRHAGGGEGKGRDISDRGTDKIGRQRGISRQEERKINHKEGTPPKISTGLERPLQI